MDSIIQKSKECYFCKSPYVHRHHVFYGPGKRPISEKMGCVAYLCQEHHTGDKGVHSYKGKNLDKHLKRLYQEKLEENMSRDEFIKLFGKSFI